MASISTVAVLALLALAGASEVSPVQKVIELLEENKVKIASDLAAEEKEMAEYATFCDDTLTEKGYAIKDATRAIADLKAEIVEGEAEIQELSAEVATLGTETAAKEKELAAATAVRTEKKAAFEKTEAELLTSIDELERAVATIKSGSAFLQAPVKQRVNAAMAAISRIVEATEVNVEKKRAIQNLMQTAKDNDDLSLSQSAPEPAAFESATGGIVEKVEEMKEKAEDSLSDTRSGEMQAQHAFDMATQSLTDGIKVGKEKLAAAKSGIESAEEEMGKAKGELSETEKAKASDETYVASLTQECDQTKMAWDERQASAKEEMAVIDKAKAILADGVKAFVQLGGQVAVRRASSVASNDADNDSLREATARAHVVNKLKELSRHYRSYALMEMVSAASADPFVKIRGLIEDMIAKLMQEANEEATQKAFCDEEMGKSKTSKEDKTAKLDKLTARLEKATTTKAELENSVKELEAEIAELDKSDAEATALRGEEHATYLKASKDFKDSAEAVTAAITMLKEYYEGALLQTGARSAAKVPTFGSAKGDAASSIISILEMSGEDFEKLYMETEQEETEAVAAYKKLTDENKLSRAAKLAEIKGAESEVKSLEVSIKDGEEDSAVVSKELDAIESYMDKLKPQCETKAMSYEEKKARREAEIEGLKEALSILEGEAPAML